MPPAQLAVIPAAAVLFALGRLLFWRGYAGGAPSRALGFGLTFYPTALMLIVNIVDTRTQEVVWRLKSTRETTEMERLTQEQVNEIMAELFGAFPPG